MVAAGDEVNSFPLSLELTWGREDMCVGLYAPVLQVHADMCVRTCENQRSSWGVFLRHSVPHFWRLGPSVELEFSNLASPAGQQNLDDPPVSAALSVGIIYAHCCAWLFTWVLGALIQAFLFAWQALYQLSHFPKPLPQ